MSNNSRPAQPFMPPQAASAYLKSVWGIERSVQSLATYRCRGGGPEFERAGRDILYGPPALDAYAEKLLRSGSPELRGRAA